MTWHGDNQRHSEVQRKGDLKDTLREPMVPQNPAMVDDVAWNELPQKYADRVLDTRKLINYDHIISKNPDKSIAHLLKFKPDGGNLDIYKGDLDEIVYFPARYLNTIHGNKKRDGDTEYYINIFTAKEKQVELPSLEVYTNGFIRIGEGNHRIDALIKLGYKDIPVRLTYNKFDMEGEPVYTWDEIRTPRNIITIPIERAWKMREKYAFPSTMKSKRSQEFMGRLTAGIKLGNFEPIPATKTELKQGILTEGKHRLIAAKELGIKRIPIQITD